MVTEWFDFLMKIEMLYLCICRLEKRENMMLITVPKVLSQYKYLYNIFFHFVHLYAYIFVCMCKVWGYLCMYVCKVVYMPQLVFCNGKQARQIDAYTHRRFYCKGWKWNNFSVYIHTEKCRYMIFFNSLLKISNLKEYLSTLLHLNYNYIHI